MDGCRSAARAGTDREDERPADVGCWTTTPPTAAPSAPPATFAVITQVVASVTVPGGAMWSISR